MISIVVCSQSDELFKKFQSNAISTIGCEVEIIRVDNSGNKFSICEAYNYGYTQSSFSIICFIHEDVLFQTDKWGILLTEHFDKNKKIGIIGIAGGVYKTKMASPWWASEPGWQEHTRMNIIQHYKNNSKPSRNILVNPFNEECSEVISVDGVFMAVKKEVFDTCKFDNKLLKGFHGYDLDFCLQALRERKVVVVYNILLEHFSGGNANLKWFEDILSIHIKWKDFLPANTGHYKLNNKETYIDGWKRMRKNISFCIEHGADFFTVFRLYNKLTILLDNKPFILQFLYDYVVNVYRTLTIFSRQRKKQPGNYLSRL